MIACSGEEGSDPESGFDLYDPGDMPEEDLWFLPGPDLDEDDIPPGAQPLPWANRRTLIDPVLWETAQAALSGDLARVSQLFGELDTRLRGAPDGLRFRLALREAADLSWWTGDRVSVDRLGLWLGLRIGSVDDTDKALDRTAWAARRLRNGPPPSDGLEAFLERGLRDGDRLESGGALLDLAEVLENVGHLHPIVQAAVLFEAWRILGMDRTRDLEAAVLAARHGAGISRIAGQGALFLPLATTGPGAFRGQGAPERKLAAWLAGAEQATLAILSQLDQLDAWSQSARQQTHAWSGRTPSRLLQVFEAWPYVTAPLAEAQTTASRAAVQRNIDRLQAKGLIREITGQGRVVSQTFALPVRLPMLQSTGGRSESAGCVEWR